ncbi:MAG: Rrf2 family transcriptional regulator [Anaerolineae bacterium]|nr:Rrf2 family transcriptional regulator [Anaerolineae bacterium]MDW8069296.1 Rrf2 family transcriptional regulator [Anaerolineae bacterium]
MLVIRRESDYAARVLLYLAMMPPGTSITARDIARERLIPAGLARTLITRLVRSGLLTSRRGRSGGFGLARPPEQITLLEVVEAIEGPLLLNPCTEEPQECPLMPVCPVHEAWVEARRRIREHLGQITFQDLARRGEELNPSTLPLPAATERE